VTVALFFERGQPLLGVSKFRAGGGSARGQFGAALFIGANARFAAIAFDGNLVQAVAILPGFSFDRVSTLRTLGVVFF